MNFKIYTPPPRFLTDASDIYLNKIDSVVSKKKLKMFKIQYTMHYIQL